jgi:hypothetical protein
MAAGDEAAKGWVELVKSEAGRGFLVGLPSGLVAGAILVWLFVVPGEAEKRSAVLSYQKDVAEKSVEDEKNKAKTTVEAEQKDTKIANERADKLKEQVDQLVQQIAKMKTTEPIAEWFMWETNKPKKVLDDLEFTLFNTMSKTSSGFRFSINTPVLSPYFEITNSMPIEFEYKNKIYYLVAEPAQANDDDPRVRLRIFDHPPNR